MSPQTLVRFEKLYPPDHNYINLYDIFEEARVNICADCVVTSIHYEEVQNL